MNTNTLLVITHQPLTRHNLIRLGVKTKYKDWNIIYWTILPLINKEIYKMFTRKGSRYIKEKNYKEIFSIFDLIKEKKRLPKKFYYLNLAGNFFQSSILERLLSFSGGNKLFFENGPEIEVKAYTINNIKNLFKNNSFLNLFIRTIFMFVEKIKNYISFKISNIKPILIFVTNNYTFQKVKNKYNKDQLIKLDSPEIELFLKAKNKARVYNKNIVFIDDVVEASFDYQLGYAQDTKRKSNDYWGPTEEFLKFIKYHFPKNKLLIAAHHRRNKNDIPIKGFKFYFDRTNQLIKDAKFVLCHNSFASQIAVLFNKPIIFLTSDYYKTFHYHSYISTVELSKTLGSTRIHLGKTFKKKSTLIKRIKNSKVDYSKYETYKKNYIQFPDLNFYGRWKSILKQLEEKKSLNY